MTGVVGSTKYCHDVWGDTVNLASRMESNGTPGLVVASSAVAAALREGYVATPLGIRDLKGQGETPFYRLDRAGLGAVGGIGAAVASAGARHGGAAGGRDPIGPCLAPVTVLSARAAGTVHGTIYSSVGFTPCSRRRDETGIRLVVEGVNAMKTIDVRIRIAILWALWAGAATYAMLLGLLVEPTALEEALAGEVEGFATDGWVGYYMAITGIVPLVLAAMTLQFDTKGARYTNLIAGLLLGVWTFFDSVYSIVDGGEFLAWMLVSAASALIAFLIAGLSAGALRRGTPERTANTH